MILNNIFNPKNFNECKKLLKIFYCKIIRSLIVCLSYNFKTFYGTFILLSNMDQVLDVFENIYYDF